MDTSYKAIKVMIRESIYLTEPTRKKLRQCIRQIYNVLRVPRTEELLQYFKDSESFRRSIHLLNASYYSECMKDIIMENLQLLDYNFYIFNGNFEPLCYLNLEIE